MTTATVRWTPAHRWVEVADEWARAAAESPCDTAKNILSEASLGFVSGSITEARTVLSVSVVFGANCGPGIRGWPGYGGPSADGLASPTKMKTFWVVKYLNIYSTNK